MEFNIFEKFGEYFSKLKKEKITNSETISVKSPVSDGKILPLKSLRDGTFSNKALGDGVAIEIPQEKNHTHIYAPVTGVVEVAFPTGNAYGIKTKSGVKILTHIGLNAVDLNGMGFTPLVKQGDLIKAGQRMVKLEMDIIREKTTFDNIIIVVPTKHEVVSKSKGYVEKKHEIFKVKKFKN